MMTPDPPPAIRPRGSDWNSFMNTATTAGRTFWTSLTWSSSLSLTGSAAGATPATARARPIRRSLRIGCLGHLSGSPLPASGRGEKNSLQYPGVPERHLVAQVGHRPVRLDHDLQ